MAMNRMAAGAAGGPTGGLEGFFRLSEHGTNVRTEVLAGLTTFFVMAYIIAVNPAVLAAAGLDPRAVATSTCLVAGLLSIAMGLYTNRAFALAPGLGLNAIVAYNLVGTMGLTPAEAMGVVVVEGILITVLVLLGVRKYVMDVVPFALSRAIAVGIGFFILFIGLRNSGVITFIPGQTGTVDGLLTLTPLNTWPIFVAMIGLVVTIVLLARGFRAAILAGILIATVIAFLVPGDVARLPPDPLAGPDFSLVGQFSFGFFAKLGLLTAVLAVISFMLSDFFDTMGTLIGVGSEAGYLDDDGDLVTLSGRSGRFPRRGRRRRLERVLGDNLHRIGGGSRSGGQDGPRLRRDRAALLLALPLVALVGAIPGGGYCPALIVVGVLMVACFPRETALLRKEQRPPAGDRLSEHWMRPFQWS
jgi:AGZA family xanthine/uracil permease-like MFS transporter